MEYKIYGLTEKDGPMKHIYIGFTIQSLEERFRKHIQRKENNYKSCWIRSLKKKGLSARIFLIKYTSKKNWVKDEQDEIQKWRNKEKKTGVKVLNLTLGGEGTLGHKHSLKTRKLFSKLRKGICNVGKKHSLETRKKMSLSSIGHHRGLGVKHKLTQRWYDSRKRGKEHPCYGTHLSLEHKKKISLADKKLTDEQILKVKQMVKDGVNVYKIAKIFKVGHSTIYRIKHNQLAYLKEWPSDKLQKG